MAKKQKLNLIEELTTHKSDYVYWPVHPVEPKSNFRSTEEPTVKPPPPHVQIDPQSHAPYSPSVHVPFDLYLRPKPIVGKDPRECFKVAKLPKKTVDSESVQLPTILSPTLPLSQVENEDDLQVILNYTYSAMHKTLMEEAVKDAINKKKAMKPPNRVVADGTDLRYKPTLYPPLPPGWVSASRHWDCLQNRSLGDPFKTFWTRRGPEVECGCCCNPLPNMIPKEMTEEIDKLISEDKLRMAYDIIKTGYSGYRPICAKGVPLEKKQMLT